MEKKCVNGLLRVSVMDFGANRQKLKMTTSMRRLATLAVVMMGWLLIWSLVLKCGSIIILERNYQNLHTMSFEERILWDLVPFNYRGEESQKIRLMIDTLLNCFVYAVPGILLCYVLKRKKIIAGAAICLISSLLIEVMQLFTMTGNPSSEDLITNLAGFFIGYIIYRTVLRRMTLSGSIRLLRGINIVLSIAMIFSFVTTVIAAETFFKIVARAL